MMMQPTGVGFMVDPLSSAPLVQAHNVPKPGEKGGPPLKPPAPQAPTHLQAK